MNPETDTSSPPPPVRNRRAPRYLWFRLSSLLCVVVLLSSFAWTHWKGEQILEETRDLARYDAFTERWCGALLAVIAAVVVLFLFWKRQWNRDLRAGLVVRKSAWAEFKRHWPLQILLGLLAVLPWYAVQQWTERIKNPLFRLPWQTEQTWVDSGRILRLVRNNGLTVTVIGNRPAARDIDRLFPEDDASARPDPPQFDVYPHESFVYRSPVSRHWAVEAIFRPSFGDHFPDWFGLAVDHLDAESFVDRVRGGCMQSGGGPTLVSPEYDGSPRSDEIGPWFAFAWVPARLETIPVYCLYADPSEAEEGVRFAFVDLSGGIGIPYRPEDEAPDVAAIGEGVRKVYEEIVPEGNVAIKTELGRWMTGPAGWLVTHAVHEKKIYRDYIGVDASAVNLMRPAMYGAYHHITVCGKREKPADHVYDVTGSLCENNDKFAIERALPEIELGDLLVIHDTGAHGYSMGYNYNGRTRSAEILYTAQGDFRMIRRAETAADYFATLDIDPAAKELK